MPVSGAARKICWEVEELMRIMLNLGTKWLSARLALAAAIAVALLGMSALGQSVSPPGNAGKVKKNWTPPKTADGQPDLQGIWSNASIVPLERTKEFEGKPILTPQELTGYENKTFARTSRDKPTAPGQVGTYNDFWWDGNSKRAPNYHTSLIVDPPDGKIPALTPEAQRRVQAERAYSRLHPADGPEDRSMMERCLSYITNGPPMLPSFSSSNNAFGPLTTNYQIVQTAGSVAILMEILHDIRVIPLDGRPHLPSTVREWLGDPRGHWEGNTLVVDSTNFTAKTKFRGADENLHLIERFTRTAPDVLMYEFTVDDPTAFTKPWTAQIPMIASDSPIFEHACHEGNYGLAGVLGGARADEKNGLNPAVSIP
jgi:hypothetical protein